jgi:hypothetical protein
MRMVRDAAGQLMYYEGTVEDISERIAAQALRSREQQLRLVTPQRETVYAARGARRPAKLPLCERGCATSTVSVPKT